MDQAQFECRSCSQERQDIVNVRRFIAKLDEFFAVNDLDGASKHIEYWESEARALNDACGLISILNEKIGLCRRLNDKEGALSTIDELDSVIASGGLKNKISGATVLVNMATTLKHFGKASEGLKYFEQAEKIYIDYCFDESYSYAALINNRAASFIDLGEYDKAIESYEKALAILKGLEDTDLQQAETLANMAEFYAFIKKDAEKANELLDKCWELLCDDYVRNGEYAFTLTKCASAFVHLGRDMEGQALLDVANEIYGQ